MKKILTILTAMTLSLTASASTTFTFTEQNSESQTIDGYTVTLGKGSGNTAPTYYANGMRLYAGNTVTVSGGNLTKLSLTFAKQGTKDYASLTASGGSLVSGGISTSADNLVTDTWTGSGSSVTFTLGTGQRLVKEIVVNGDATGGTGGDDPSDPSEPSTPSDLDPDFVYPEPTMVLVPPTTVQGEAYTFIYNNIRVSCSKGAVTDSYFSAHAGFEMTFTATKRIKGIVINGFVKKDFTATTDHGTIQYLTPSSDIAADPVVVITDIDSQSVTISCVKQLRCYEVEVYFDENPDATVEGGSSGNTPGGGEYVFDSAEAVYESEYSELIGEENYSVFLYNAASPDIPYFALDIYPESKDDLSGTYSWDDYSLGDYTYYLYGYGDYDIVWIEGGSVTISKKGNLYTISGSLIGDDSQTYDISFSGEIPIYLDEDYYGDGDDDTLGVEEIDEATTIDATVPAYDLQGRKVGRSYRGIVIRGGKKLVVH